MAEQNKKTKQQQKIRDYAKTVVDLYLKLVMATDADAGWDGINIIGRLMDFYGDLPESSGFSGVDRMPERIRLIQHWPKQFRVSNRLMMQLTAKQREAVCIDRMYRGRKRMTTDTEIQRRAEVYWSDTRCAKVLDISAGALRARISEGYRALEEIIAPGCRDQNTEAA